MILNKINNKVYIGKAVNIFSRWDSHKKNLNNNSHKNKHLNSSWMKYKEESFDFIVLEHLMDADNTILNEREKYWISFYKSSNSQYGYNKTNGGDGGAVHSSCLMNVRIANKGNKYHLGKKHSKETKKLLSEKASLQHKNYWKEESYRNKMSTQAKQLWKTKEYREKQAQSLRKVDNLTVVNIYKDCELEKSNKKLSLKYSVSTTMVSNIRNKKGWYSEIIDIYERVIEIDKN